MKGLEKNFDSCTVTPKEWGVSEVSAYPRRSQGALAFITPYSSIVIAYNFFCDYLFIYHDIQRVPIGYIIGKKQHGASPMRFYACTTKYTTKKF
jgi:hypothetical protein